MKVKAKIILILDCKPFGGRDHTTDDFLSPGAYTMPNTLVSVGEKSKHTHKYIQTGTREIVDISEIHDSFVTLRVFKRKEAGNT